MNSMCRQSYILDGIWDFKKENEDNYRPIAVPASWNEQYEDLYQYHGKGIYIKQFVLPKYENDKAVILYIGSVSGKTSVFINDKQVAYNEVTALPIEVDITSNVCIGKNTLKIISDNTLDPWSLPPAVMIENEGRVGFNNSYPAVTYDFFPYSGIHRSVIINIVPKVRIKDITIKTQLNDNDSADVFFEIEVSEIYDGVLNIYTGNIHKKLLLNKTNNLSGKINISSPKLWDIGKPNLYEFNIYLYDNKNNLIDEFSQKYGIRTIEIKNNKIHLNNREIFLKGFGKHEDFPIIGKGFFAPVVIKDFDIMCRIGANSFRTSHYPYDENILTLADELGILVISETPLVGLNDRMYRDDILDKAKSIIKRLIKRDKNHPSVIAWSLANEPNITSDEGENFFKEMADTARKNDNTRPITYAAHLEPDNNRCAKYFDFICINKYYGWYIGPGQINETLHELSDCLDRFRNEFDKPIMITEFGADAIAGMHASPPVMFSEEYQSEIIEKQYNLFMSKDYIIGTHIWAFADFRTAQSISRIIDNRKGLFTRTRQPKMAAHTIKRLWNS